MFGGTLALLTHSLQLDARLLRHHIYRLLFVLILYVFILMATMQSLFVGAPGQWLFGWISHLNFWFISLSGISFFATAISEEKEEETLGILRMAGISPTSLLLGKSTSRLIVAALLLSLQIPFALLAITLGGVTTHQIYAIFIALLAYTAFVANLALVCSVVARRASGASFLMTLLLGLFFFSPPLIQWIISLVGSSGNVAQYLDVAAAKLAEMSVFDRLSTILATSFDESAFSFQVKTNLVAGLLLFIFSRVIFDRVTRYHAVATSSRGILMRPRGWLSFLGTGRTWKRALIWKDFHFITGGKPMLVLKFVGYGLVTTFAVVISVADGSSNPFWGMFLWTVPLISLMLLVESTMSASRVFREEVQLNSLSSLMLLPHRPSAIAYLKVVGCLIGLLPGLLFLGTGVIFAFVALALEDNSDTIFLTVFFGSMGTITGFAFMLFFVHLVAYLSLVVKWGAIPMSIGIGLVALVLFGCFMGMIASFAFIGGAVGLHFMIGSKFRQLGMQ